MSTAADLLGVTEETFSLIKAATSGTLVSTGIAGIDLLDDLLSWVPVDTPFFNSTPRGPGKGATAAFYQALVNVNSQQPDGGIQKEFSAPLAKLQNQYVYSPYAAVGIGGTVSWDAIAQGLEYADALAVGTLQTINQLLISLEIHQLNAQSFALPTTGTPTLTASTTGGTISGSATCYVKCAARSGINWYRGGSNVASSEANVATSGSTASVTASVTAVKGAAGYDWYVGSSTGAEFYYTTTPTNTVTITAIPTAAQLVPTIYAGLFNAGLAGPSAVPTADSSFQTYYQNGLVASILGDFASQPDQALQSGTTANLVTPGSGTAQGSYYTSLDGAPLTVSGAALAQIDAMNKTIYDTYQVTPSRMLMGSQSITDISNALLDNPQAVVFLQPGEDGRANTVAGGHVGTYLNKTVNGKPIELHLMPYLPPGKIVSVIDSLPFPGSNVRAALQVRTLYDFFRFDYGANRVANTSNGGPRYDFEVRCQQAFINKASVVMGVLDNIGAGVG